MTSDLREQSIWRTPVGVIALVVAVIGALARVWHFAGNRNFWLDEAMLALNLRDRSLSELTGVLDYLQSAPTGFLYYSKLATMAFGLNEMTLRALPLLASLAALPLAYLFARSLFGPFVAALVLIAVSINEQLVYYAAEFKQYGLDVLLTLLVFAATLYCLRRNETRALWPLVLLGVVAPWFSNPSIFVLATVGLVIFVQALSARDWPRSGVLVAVGVVWLASLALSLYTNGTFDDTLGGMQESWNDEFAPFPPTSVGDLRWYLEHFIDAGRIWHQARPLAMCLVAVGIVALWVRDRTWCCILVGPLLLAGVASALQLYPFYGRFLLFAAPCLIILAVLGVELLVAHLPRARAAVVCVLVGLMLLPGAATLASKSLESPPFGRHFGPAIIDVLERELQPGDRIVVNYSGLPVYEFYAEGRSVRDWPTAITREPRQSWDFTARDAIALSGTGRAWIVFIDAFRPVRDGVAFASYYFDKVGKRLRRHRFGKDELLLYDFGDTKVDALRIDGRDVPPYEPSHEGRRAMPHIPYLD